MLRTYHLYSYLQFLCFFWSLREREEPKGRKTLRVTKKESEEHLNIAAIFQPNEASSKENGEDLALGTSDSADHISADQG